MVKGLKNVKVHVFDAQAFLDSVGVARKVKAFKRADVVYSQGDAAKSVMYLQEGGVKLSVVSEVGKEAVVAILGPGDFFGEGCLAGQSVRMGTATAITPSTVLVIKKSEMFKVLHDQVLLNSNVPRQHEGDEPVGEREAARPHSSIACPLRKRRQAPRSTPQHIARNARGDDRYNTPSGQIF
jgi:CRP-like cAMP-binding protein